MPRKPNKGALERALKHRESQQRCRTKVAKRARTQTIHEALPVAGRIARQGGPLFDSGGDGVAKDEDEDDGGSSAGEGGIAGGGVILRKAPSEGGQVILQRLTKSSTEKGTQLLRDAREIKRLKEELDVALKVDERTGVEPIALGLRAQEIKLEEVKREEGGGRASQKLCAFTNDHLQAEPACNAFLVALRHFTRSYVDTLEPVFHQDFRERLEKRQPGFERLKDVVGQDQVSLFTPNWTAVRILDEGSRTTWQSWESDATPTLLIPFGPPVVLELEYGSVELEEGQFCLFDAALKHRIVLSTSTRNKRKRRQYVRDDGRLERPWCVCAFACADMVGREEEEEDELEEEVAWVVDEERMLKDPPEVSLSTGSSRLGRRGGCQRRFHIVYPSSLESVVPS